jgi:hypothetical protein
MSYNHKAQEFTGKPYVGGIFITVFDFVGQFFFQNYVFKHQKVFSELEIRVFLENGLVSFKTFLILQTNQRCYKD